jgi:hypothetical protein
MTTLKDQVRTIRPEYVGIEAPAATTAILFDSLAREGAATVSVCSLPGAFAEVRV